VRKRYRTEVVEATSAVPLLEQLKTELAEYFDGRRSRFTVPLDPKGTEFERKVWNQLLKIRCGETLSYGEMAVRVGRPGGARAVGRANGSNYIAILIPCHRVIETGGGLGGYGGKIWRKKRLLELEASQTAIAL
jgi:O-6-methylguanine DNA methyltransferase